MKNIFNLFIRLFCVVLLLLTSVCAYGTESNWEKFEKVVNSLNDETQKSSPNARMITFLQGEFDRLVATPEVRKRLVKQMERFRYRHPHESLQVMKAIFLETTLDKKNRLRWLFFSSVVGDGKNGNNPALNELRAFIADNSSQKKDNENVVRDSEELKENTKEATTTASIVAEETALLASEIASEVLDSALKEANEEELQTASMKPACERKRVASNKKNSVREDLKPIAFTLPDGTRMEFMPIPAGTFVMGSPEDEEGHADDENQVRVNITKAFYMGKTEVTEAQFLEFFDDDSPSGNKNDEPVAKVSWNEAMEYCKALTKWAHKQGKFLGWMFTLPTEAQWEYACRAGTTTMYHSGGKRRDLKRVAWYDETSGCGVNEVAQKEPNLWGLYDMHGNVWEWCSDWYARELQGGDDPTGPESGSRRVYRGGSWSYDAQRCRSAFRYCYSPGSRSDGLGFRVALVRE